MESAAVQVTVGPVQERGLGVKEGLRVETLDMDLEQSAEACQADEEKTKFRRKK